jgi:putative spermidine/putrescine transport system permease protein
MITPTRRSVSNGRIALYLFTSLTLVFLVAPILVVFPLSFSSGELLALPTPGYSLRWYEEFFNNSRWLDATKNSFVVGIATMLLATTLATLAAVGIFIGRFRGKTVLLAILSLPMVTPHIVTAIAIYFTFSAVGLSSTLTGLVLSHTILSVPFVLVTVLASLQSFDVGLLRAAASLGAPPATTFRRVVAPLILPGIISGALFAFATSFDELVVALFIASPAQFTLPRQMYAGIREFLSPTIASAAVLLILCSLCMLALNEFIRLRAKQYGAARPNG